MDLFDAARPTHIRPLADRMRPAQLDDYLGQDEAIGPGSTLRRLLDRRRLRSLVLYGPAGTGKTTLARLIARHLDATMLEVSAVSSGVKELRDALTVAAERYELGQPTILFVDEIHRFNRSQQDVLLPAVENGRVVLIGATTENPFFELNGPLLSRCLLVRLHALDDRALRAILERALVHPDGLNGKVTLDPDAAAWLIAIADGDARLLLSALDQATAAFDPDTDEALTVTLDDLRDTTRRWRYDKAADAHYDHASAFIKAIRGSDPDAAVYWLARMLAGGEDPRFIARRLVIHASEDIGMADPTALLVATAAAQALDRVGLPEARLALAQATLHLARAPKSNAVLAAIDRAEELVASTGNLPVPAHLRDAHYPGAATLGHGEGYLYPHDHPEGHVEQDYLPEQIADRRGQVYRPTPRDLPAT